MTPQLLISLTLRDHLGWDLEISKYLQGLWSCAWVPWREWGTEPWVVVVIPTLNQQKEALRRQHEVLKLCFSALEGTPWALVWFTTKKGGETDEVVYWSRIKVIFWCLTFHSLWGKAFESTSLESYESTQEREPERHHFRFCPRRGNRTQQRESKRIPGCWELREYPLGICSTGNCRYEIPRTRQLFSRQHTQLVTC